MAVIELIGLRTSTYDDIKANLLSFLEINKINLDFIETNDPETILTREYLSIPLIQIDEERLYLNDANHDKNLSQLRVLLKRFKKKTKSHSCLNCGNCKCPADREKKPAH